MARESRVANAAGVHRLPFSLLETWSDGASLLASGKYKIGYIIEGSNSNSFSNRTPVNYLKIGVPVCIISREPHSLCTRILQPKNACSASAALATVRAARDHFRVLLHRFVLTIPHITQPSTTSAAVSLSPFLFRMWCLCKLSLWASAHQNHSGALLKIEIRI